MDNKKNSNELDIIKVQLLTHSYKSLLATSEFDGSEKFENPPTFFTTKGSKSFDLFAPFFNYFCGAHESKGWFSIFEVKTK